MFNETDLPVELGYALSLFAGEIMISRVVPDLDSLRLKIPEKSRVYRPLRSIVPRDTIRIGGFEV